MLDRTDHNRLAEAAKARFAPSLLSPAAGHNNPPGPIDFAKETATALSDFLRDHPVIQSDEDAREGKLHIDRAKGVLDSMEKERDQQVRPLNDEVAAINGRYRGPRTTLESLMAVLKRCLTGYAKELERQRIAAAEAAEAKRAEAERLAREAEAREKAAVEDAEQGVCVDIGQATIEADEAFQAFEKANRESARAERDTKVRLTGGFGNAIGLRERETLTVTDWKAAIDDIGLTEDIAQAIIKGARAYRKENRDLPAGIAAGYERAI